MSSSSRYRSAYEDLKLPPIRDPAYASPRPHPTPRCMYPLDAFSSTNLS